MCIRDRCFSCFELCIVYKSHFSRVFCLFAWFNLTDSVFCRFFLFSPGSQFPFVFSTNSLFSLSLFFERFYHFVNFCWCLQYWKKINSSFLTASTVPQMLCYLILSLIEFTEQLQKSTSVVSVRWHFTFDFIQFMFHIWWAAFCCSFQITCPFLPALCTIDFENLLRKDVFK